MSKKLLVTVNRFLPTATTIGPILYRIILNINVNRVIVNSKEYEEDSKFPKWLLEDTKNIQLKKIYCKQTKKFKFIQKLIIKFKEIMNILINILKKPDIILTSTMPFDKHWYGIIAKILSIKKIKWVAFFSDPYSNSPFETVGDGKLILFFRRIEEKLVFKYADKIIYISEAQREFSYKGKNKEKQTLIIPFYYLSEWKEKILQNIKNKKSYAKNRINFVHPGNIYGNRKPDEFFKALKKFEGKVDYYNCGRFDEELISKYNLSKIITSLGHIDYEILLENIKEADYVIVIDSFFKDIKNPYMPSKVVDAMYFDKPIIAITDKDTELDKFCKKTGNLSIENDSKLIEEILEKLVKNEIEIVPNYSMYCDLIFNII